MVKPPNGNHDKQAQQDHVQALKEADETLARIQIDVIAGRARLQRAIARYEERASGPQR